MHELDKYLTSLLTTPGAPLSGLAVVVYRQGQICYEGYFGQRRIDPPPADDASSNLCSTARGCFCVSGHFENIPA
ncbi:MAG: hypothetical protein ACKO4U_02675 [Caldilinea sp.]